MERIFTIYARLLSNVDDSFTRYLFQQIDWSNKLIVIKGAKGVGKTTMLLQHIKQAFKDPRQALYASVDNIWFSSHSILELAEYHYSHGGTHLFLDEIHKYRNWEQEVKNLYDSYPGLHIVITGSSMLKIEESVIADLSRRCRQYNLVGLSFREYLKLERIIDLPTYSLEEILSSHIKIAADITSKVKILHHFEEYLKHGYYPFYREEGDGYFDRLQQVISTIIEVEIPSVGKIEFDSVCHAKQLLAILAERTPYTINISSLVTSLGSSRNNVLKLMELLDKAALIRRLYSSAGMNQLVKPEKILFDNTNIMYSLSNNVDVGTIRETYFASQLAVSHKIHMPDQGDLIVDDVHTFEVGGKGKKFSQIKDIADSYVVSDGIDIGFGNKIPLWLFGLMY